MNIIKQKMKNTILLTFSFLFLCSISSFAAGSVNIVSNPSGSDIYLDGINTGQVTPYTFSDITSIYNPHIIVIRKTGSIAAAPRTFTVVNNSTGTVSIDFSSEQSGSALITSTPSGSSIYIDGINTGQVTPYTFSSMGVNGPHTLILRKSGYSAPGTQSFYTSSGSTTTVSVDFSSEQSGSAYVYSNVAGASIYLDGIDTGMATPYTFSDLASATYGGNRNHTVTIRKTGWGKPGTKNIQTSPSSTLWVYLDLEDITPPTGTPNVPVSNSNYSQSTTISFTWSSGTLCDLETGISGYNLQVSTTPGGKEKLDAYMSGFLTWSITGCTQGKTYYARVRAANGSGLYSDYSSNSTGITIDTTTPTIPGIVRDGTGADVGYTSSSSTLSANWSTGLDLESGITRYWYAIGTTPGATNVLAWTNNGTAISATKDNLNLASEQVYYFSVTAENGSGLLSPAKNSNGQTVDLTPPSAIMDIRDGLGTDADYTNSVAELSANWNASTDSGSGLMRYWYAIGTSAGATDIQAWTDNGSAVNATKSGLSLINNAKYYFSIQVEDIAGNKNTPTSSNGQIVDSDALIMSQSAATVDNWCYKTTAAGTVEVFIPAGTFSISSVVTINENPVSTVISQANSKIETSDSRILAPSALSNSIYDISSTKMFNGGRKARITIPYPAGFSPSLIKDLRIACLNTVTAEWSIQESEVSITSRAVSAWVAHFSIYRLVVTAAFANDLSGAIVYPNPYRPSATVKTITFKGLTSGSNIKIYDLSGKLVFDSPVISTGRYEWPVVNSSGDNVTSGIYIYRIHDNYQAVSGKISIIR
ncbi:MAG: hypothetical protein A2297_00370 [Elusimicrobia bacterium RIFOXYB2_FULL_48_7]|nr:MAG: hypothetical protein A2297_00370 [Elusimicrobia bacterium RIFOXYB2_FULL_48_7]